MYVYPFSKICHLNGVSELRKNEAGMLEAWVGLIEGGASVLDSVDELVKLYPEFESQMRLIGYNLSIGYKLHQAMLEQKDSFSPITICLAGIGEETNSLDTTLKKASELLRFQQQYGSNQQGQEILFYYQMGVLNDLGIPVLRSLRFLASFSKDTYPPGEILEKIADNVEGGSCLSEAMDRQEKYFPKWITERVKNAEVEGSLDNEMLKISEELQKRYISKK